jgi:hypothetical protein
MSEDNGSSAPARFQRPARKTFLYRPFLGLNVRSGSVGSFPIPLERGLDCLCDPFRCHH